jgi:5-methylcytosine-specific restriction endonuclease McrA
MRKWTKNYIKNYYRNLGCIQRHGVPYIEWMDIKIQNKKRIDTLKQLIGLIKKRKRQLSHCLALEREKIRRKLYKQSHPDIIREQKRRWSKKHPKQGHCGGIRKEAFEKIKAKYGYKCAICGKQEPFLNQYWHYLTQDHIIPRSKGGRKRCASNIQPLCWSCNIKKSNKL